MSLGRSTRPRERFDTIWFGALPAFYVLMTFYGITAALYPITAVQATQGPDRAMIFGIAIAIVGVLLLAAHVGSLLWRWIYAEFWLTVVFLLLMVVYIVAIYHAVLGHEMGVRPGSGFLPLLFSVFPFTRALVMVRSGLMKWPHVKVPER